MGGDFKLKKVFVLVKVGVNLENYVICGIKELFMATSGKNKSENKIILRNLSDIRAYWADNQTPIYFISATNFNLLGADEWVRNFKYICYLDCFDGQHTNVFVPTESPHEIFQSIEEINNYLLEHKEVGDYIQGRGGKPKAMFLMFDEETEKVAKSLKMDIWFPKAKLRTYLDNKVITTRVAQKAGVESVPNILCKVDSFATLRKVSKSLGEHLVVQTPFGDSGHTTFFISNEKDFQKHSKEIIEEKEVKIMKRINCRGSAIEGCVTKNGTIVAPLMTELVGFPELTPYKGGWCGNEIYPNAFTQRIRKKAKTATQDFGEQLRKEGYFGYFELDFLIDIDNNELYLGELNPRVTGASSITNHALFAYADIPLFMFHLTEYADVEMDISINQINQRWNNPKYIDSWSQLIIKHTENNIDIISEAPPSGLYQINKDNEINYLRYDTHRHSIENESQAFFLRISKTGDYRYEGADLGILIARGRMMTDDFKLTQRAKNWINGIRSQFKGKAIPKSQPKPAEIGGFKML